MHNAKRPSCATRRFAPIVDDDQHSAKETPVKTCKADSVETIEIVMGTASIQSSPSACMLSTLAEEGHRWRRHVRRLTAVIEQPAINFFAASGASFGS